MERTFKYATGWLGLSPREAKKTPICEIYMALDAHVEYLTETSVYHGGPMLNKNANKAEPDDVANDLRNVFGRMSKNG